MPSLTDLSPLVPRLPQFAQAKNRIVSQMSVIRQQLSMIEAYDMDGWKGARYAVSRDLAFTTQRRSTRSVPRRGASSDEQTRRSIFFFFFRFASASPFDALTKPKHTLSLDPEPQPRETPPHR